MQPIHVAATNNFIPFCLALLLANFISSAFTLVKCMRNLALAGYTGMLLKAYKEAAMVQLSLNLIIVEGFKFSTKVDGVL